MNQSFGLHFDAYPRITAAITDHPIALGAAAVLGGAVAWYFLTTNSSHITKIRGWPIVGQWAFFTKRYDFIMKGFRRVPGEPMFRFSILKHNVFAIRGEEARKVFYDQQGLGFTEGYLLLFGGAKDAKDADEELPAIDDQAQILTFNNRLGPLLRIDRIAALIPLLMSDIERNMTGWGSSGTFDPFEDINSIIFQLTVRTATCREIADSVENCKRMEKIYWNIEKGTTPATVLLPWLPSSARNRQKEATAEMYTWLDDIVKARQTENRREEDALQDLIDLGDSTADIMRFVLRVLFAGIITTALMGTWIFIFLDQEPQWKAKAEAEIKSLLDKYAPNSQSYSSAAERLSDIPPEAWEGEMPVLEASHFSSFDCLRETIRLILSQCFLRRVMKGDVLLAGRKIPTGSYLVHLVSEVHLNPDIYPEPTRFNPGRFSEGQDKSQYHAFVGWGVGRHPCLGRRFAQYEIKALCAMLLSQYDYEVVNSKGVRPSPYTIIPDRNDLYLARPKEEKIYISYAKKADVL
ncbi:cytochrome P450 family protein [Ceratobasidium sp. AG-Ba]|nr:cytochrome P450 family protein [Ceratobasidium sp. AG-Ba]